LTIGIACGIFKKVLFTQKSAGGDRMRLKIIGSGEVAEVFIWFLRNFLVRSVSSRAIQGKDESRPTGKSLCPWIPDAFFGSTAVAVIIDDYQNDDGSYRADALARRHSDQPLVLRGCHSKVSWRSTNQVFCSGDIVINCSNNQDAEKYMFSYLPRLGNVLLVSGRWPVIYYGCPSYSGQSFFPTELASGFEIENNPFLLSYDLESCYMAARTFASFSSLFAII
jgi:hypothetical protein